MACLGLLLARPDALGQSPVSDEFNPGVAGYSLDCLAVQPDGKILVGGWFWAVGGQARENIARLNPDGTLDTCFNPGAQGTNRPISSLVVQADGKILVGGEFMSLGGQAPYIGRLNPDGTLDAGFDPEADGYVYSLALQADGKILVGGFFHRLGGQPRDYIGRLNPDGSLDTGFDPGVNGSVGSLVIQSDGKILVGGGFTTVGGQARNRIARLNPDGTLDTGFNPGAGGDSYLFVYSLALQPDGKILVGGRFTTLGGQPRNCIGRLNLDGTVDPGFNPGVGSDYTPYVNSLAVQADGKILVGGGFIRLGGQTRIGIGRLNSDGTLDTGFDPGANYAPMNSLAVQADGKVVVVGHFTTLGGQPRNYIGRLNATDPATQSLSYDGSTIAWLRGGTSPEVWRTVFDWTSDGLLWTPLGEGTRLPGGWQRTNAIVPAQAMIRARGFVAGGPSGWFVEDYWGPWVWLSQPVSRTNDAASTATFEGRVGGTPPLSYQWFKGEVAITDDTHIAGATTTRLTLTDVRWADTGGYYLVVSNAYGSLTSAVATLTVNDPVIATSPGNQNRQVGENALLSVAAWGTTPLRYQWWKDGVALAGRTESSLTLTNLDLADTGAYRVVVSGSYSSATSSVAWLAVNGATLDTGFNLGANGYINSLAVQVDGKIVVGGNFTMLDGQPRSSIGRLDPDGALDTGFNPGTNGYINSLAVQMDGKIVVGGNFTMLGGQPRSSIGRLNPDGKLDAGFNPVANGFVYSLAVQPDGKILVGGGFTMLGGQPRNRIARLNVDGTLDTAFDTEANDWVLCLALQADGKILVGGFFTTLGGESRLGIGRLNPDGTLDVGFNAGAYGGVYSLTVQPDGKILVGGRFTTLGVQPRSCIGRLNPDGVVDIGFDPGAEGGQFGPFVSSLAMQSDGKILVAGDFTTLRGQMRERIARLNPDGTLDTRFAPGADGTANSLTVQADGKILVGGGFTTLAGQPRNYIARLNATDPATQSLGYDGSNITWLRGGTSPEAWRATFDYSTNGVDWTSLGMGTRIAGGWQLTGVALPTNSTLRARGYTTGGNNNASSWFVESLLTVSAPKVPPMLSVDSMNGPSLWFKLTGGTNAQYAVETATNLPSAEESWQPVTTLTLTNGCGLFDWTNTGESGRFFRAK